MVIVFSTNAWLEKIEKTMDYARSQKYTLHSQVEVSCLRTLDVLSHKSGFLLT